MDGTLIDLLEHKAAVNADKALYSFLDRQSAVSATLTHQALYERARGLACTLQRYGCGQKPVLLYCPHGPEFLVAFFACVLAGAWPVPVTRHRAQSQTGLTQLFKACGATAVISTSNRAGSLLRSLAGSGILVLHADKDASDADAYRRPTLSPSDPAFIQYTSGSTSSPKGVLISHANVMHNSAQIRQAFASTEDDVGVSWVPFHHDMGLIGHVIQPLFAGIHNYFISPVDFIAKPARWLQAISDVGGTISGGPDFGYSLATEKICQDELAGFSLSQWRLAYCGAEKIRPETLIGFAQKFSPSGFRNHALFPCYGLAESTLFVSGQYGLDTHRPARTQRGRSSVCLGKPATGTSVIIVNPESDNEVADGHAGEVCISSASVALGYFNDPVVTNKVFSRIMNGSRRYVRTGDTGFLHDQRLYLLGRYKNVIKRRGCSYHAEDIEAALKLGLGGCRIARCAAFAVNDHNAEMLVVMLEQPRSAGWPGDMHDRGLIDRARALVVDEFGIVPDDIRVLPANTLPLTSSGKIQRGACPDWYRQRIKILGSSMSGRIVHSARGIVSRRHRRSGTAEKT